jgi:hypothetical protein
MLRAEGFSVDSSTLWGEANRLNAQGSGFVKRSVVDRFRSAARRALGGLAAPYVADSDDVEKTGASSIVEFPIAYSIYEARSLKRRLYYNAITRLAACGAGTHFAMLFFHIDELLARPSGSRTDSELDVVVTRHFETHLSDLKSRGVEFMTCSDARALWVSASEDHPGVTTLHSTRPTPSA